MNRLASLLLVLAFAAAAHAQVQGPPGVPENGGGENPLQPPARPDKILDQGCFDIYKFGTHTGVEFFSIAEKADGRIQMTGQVTYAVKKDAKEEGSQVWEFFPDLVIGVRGLEKYSVRAKFPEGAGDISVWFEKTTGEYVLKRALPGQQESILPKLDLPKTGAWLIDRNLVHQWSIVGLDYLQMPETPRKRRVADPDTGHVIDFTLSPAFPAKVENWSNSIPARRVLVTTGGIGTNLWFDAQNRLVRMESPHYEIKAVRRGAYGDPSARVVKPEPAAPHSVEVNVQTDNAVITGELTLPEGAGPFPCLAFISDTGPQDRDGNPERSLYRWNIYRDIAHDLARRGIACYRGDDPRTGMSPLIKQDATIADWVVNARATLKQLAAQPNLDPKRIGVIGHGEGSLIALKLASTREVPFAILLSAHGTLIDSIIVDQYVSEMKALGYAQDQIKVTADYFSELHRLFMDPTIKDWKEPAVPEKYVRMGGGREYFRDLMSLDPEKLARDASIPVLLIHGKEDRVIPFDHYQRLSKALPAATATCREFAGLDHLLMPVINGEAGDKADPDRRIDPAVLEAIGTWASQR